MPKWRNFLYETRWLIVLNVFVQSLFLTILNSTNFEIQQDVLCSTIILLSLFLAASMIMKQNEIANNLPNFTDICLLIDSGGEFCDKYVSFLKLYLSKISDVSPRLRSRYEKCPSTIISYRELQNIDPIKFKMFFIQCAKLQNVHEFGLEAKLVVFVTLLFNHFYHAQALIHTIISPLALVEKIVSVSVNLINFLLLIGSNLYCFIHIFRAVTNFDCFNLDELIRIEISLIVNGFSQSDVSNMR